MWEEADAVLIEDGCTASRAVDWRASGLEAYGVRSAAASGQHHHHHHLQNYQADYDDNHHHNH